MERDLFALALDARVALAKAHVAAGYDEYEAYMESEEAWTLAREVGRRFPNEPMPVLLSDKPLTEAWTLGREEVLCEEQEAIDAARIEQALAAKNWKALDMSTPAEIVRQLRAGEAAEVNGHSLEFDDELHLIWMTNPYGCDGVLCDGLNEAQIERFLIDMARGVTYGATP